MVKELMNDKKYFPYPHKFETTHSIKEIVEKYDSLCKEKGQFLEDEVAVAGRVYSRRKAGKFLLFFDLQADSVTIQIMANRKMYPDEEEFEKNTHIIKRGDIMGVRGKIGRSKTGELSIVPDNFKLLSPCLHALPK